MAGRCQARASRDRLLCEARHRQVVTRPAGIPSTGVRPAEGTEAMRVLLAGASGAVGTPLTRQLIAAGHEVVGISRSQANAERLRNAGADAVVADVLDREGLLAAVRGVRAEAVMHQL